MAKLLGRVRQAARKLSPMRKAKDVVENVRAKVRASKLQMMPEMPEVPQALVGAPGKVDRARQVLASVKERGEKRVRTAVAAKRSELNVANEVGGFKVKRGQKHRHHR